MEHRKAPLQRALKNQKKTTLYMRKRRSKYMNKVCNGNIKFCFYGLSYFSQPFKSYNICAKHKVRMHKYNTHIDRLFT